MVKGGTHVGRGGRESPGTLATTPPLPAELPLAPACTVGEPPAPALAGAPLCPVLALPPAAFPALAVAPAAPPVPSVGSSDRVDPQPITSAPLANMDPTKRARFDPNILRSLLKSPDSIGNRSQ